MTVVFKQLARIIQVSKYLPLHFVPLTTDFVYELLFLTDPSVYPGSPPTNPATIGACSTDSTSTSWAIVELFYLNAISL